MPLLVRNLEPNATIFSKGTVFIQWAVAGDVNGEDIQRVPDDVADDVDFLRSLDRGILAVEDSTDPAVLAKIQQQTVAFRTRRQKTQEDGEASIERRQDKDIVQVTCIGTARGGVTCGKPVLIKSALKGSVPPLCDGHKKFSAEYVATESGSEGVEGGKKVVWSRVRVGDLVKVDN